jgi:glycosyltransferase involved in cell wall biosynthesis
MNNPKISIITVNLNNAAGLDKTILSVAKQNYSDLEYIIIDGGSTDDSNDVINRNGKVISYSISEKDKGIYNAMNKGIVKATGEYLLFLNSGDTLINENSLQRLTDQGKNADIIYGDIKMSENSKSREVIFPQSLSFKFFFINSLPHPCTLIRKELFNVIGYYREDFKIASDWAFFVLAICKYNCSYQHVNETIADFVLGGVSSTQLHIIEIERNQIYRDFFSAFADDYKEMFKLEMELNNARKQLGYRLHKKVKTIFLKNG